MADVRRLLNIPSGDNTVTDTEVQDFIDDAFQQIAAELGGKQEDVFAVVAPVRRKLYLHFSPVLSVTKVWVEKSTEETELVENTDYTVDLSEGLVTVSDDVSLLTGYKVHVWYVPEFYGVLEAYLACIMILERGLLDTGDSVQASLYDRMKQRVDEYFSLVKSRPVITFAYDHLEGYDVW